MKIVPGTGRLYAQCDVLTRCLIDGSLFYEPGPALIAIEEIASAHVRTGENGPDGPTMAVTLNSGRKFVVCCTFEEMQRLLLRHNDGEED
jgi:hypothetical protein